MDTAKIFWSGRSQAVRLPEDFRFEHFAKSNCPFLNLEVILAALEQAALQTAPPS